MRVLIHHDNASAWQAALAERLPEAEFANSGDHGSFQADYLVAWNPPAALLASQKALKGIINIGAGVDGLLDNPSTPPDVPIVKLHDAGMGDLIADYCRYGVLHFQRGFDRYRDLQSTGQWHRIELTPRQSWPIGVLGLGAIGVHVAKVLAADGYPVLGWSRSPKSVENVSCYRGNDGLFELLGQVRTLITLLPNTPETRGIINTRTLSALAPGATLINPGRGALIDDAALLDALGGKNGQS